MEMSMDRVMNTVGIEKFLNEFKWETLSRMYGLARSSVIGFISSERIKRSSENSIIDGVPSAKTGGGRKGQRNADILLCKGDKPFVVVEVETVFDSDSYKKN